MFNAATIWWANGLSSPPGHVNPSRHGVTQQGVDKRVQQITHNLMQVTDEDYEKALHNPVQQDHAMPRNESHASSQEVKKTRECESLLVIQWATRDSNL